LTETYLELEAAMKLAWGRESSSENSSSYRHHNNLYSVLCVKI